MKTEKCVFILESVNGQVWYFTKETNDKPLFVTFNFKKKDHLGINRGSDTVFLSKLQRILDTTRFFELLH